MNTKNNTQNCKNLLEKIMNNVGFIKKQDQKNVCKCGRTFSDKRMYNWHQRNECGSNFICLICSKVFSRKSHLKAHKH